jgi:hypothetical protein
LTDETEVIGTMNESEELKDYRDGVEKLFELNSEKIISNGMPEHAAILFEAFFKHAKHQIVILCRHLHGDVFGKGFVIAAAKQALARDVSLRIITQEKDLQAREFVEAIKSSGRAKLEYASTEKGRTLPYNFAVMDGKAFRFESDRDKVQAQASMNCPDIAKRLTQVFEELSPVAATA